MSPNNSDFKYMQEIYRIDFEIANIIKANRLHRVQVANFDDELMANLIKISDIYILFSFFGDIHTYLCKNAVLKELFDRLPGELKLPQVDINRIFDSCINLLPHIREFCNSINSKFLGDPLICVLFRFFSDRFIIEHINYLYNWLPGKCRPKVALGINILLQGMSIKFSIDLFLQSKELTKTIVFDFLATTPKLQNFDAYSLTEEEYKYLVDNGVRLPIREKVEDVVSSWALLN